MAWQVRDITPKAGKCLGAAILTSQLTIATVRLDTASEWERASVLQSPSCWLPVRPSVRPSVGLSSLPLTVIDQPTTSWTCGGFGDWRRRDFSAELTTLTAAPPAVNAWSNSDIINPPDGRTKGPSYGPMKCPTNADRLYVTRTPSATNVPSKSRPRSPPPGRAVIKLRSGYKTVAAGPGRASGERPWTAEWVPVLADRGRVLRCRRRLIDKTIRRPAGRPAVIEYEIQEAPAGRAPRSSGSASDDILRSSPDLLMTTFDAMRVTWWRQRVTWRDIWERRLTDVSLVEPYAGESITTTTPLRIDSKDDDLYMTWPWRNFFIPI